jgi:hypothetical protein
VVLLERVKLVPDKEKLKNLTRPPPSVSVNNGYGKALVYSPCDRSKIKISFIGK